jgi:hypothetical protein
VVPLTVTTTNSDELLGGAGVHPAHDDAIANRVLVKGEPIAAPPGRADDFAWPPGGDHKSASASAAVPQAKGAAPANAPIATPKPEERKGKAADRAAAEKAKLAQEKKTTKPRHEAHRPPPIRQDPLGWLR